MLHASPDELDRHRVALSVARSNRLELISQSTERLMTRIEAATAIANTKVLLHPTTSRAVVHSSNQVTTAVVDFHRLLGIESGRQSLEARRWIDAATEVKDRALETGAEGVGTAKRLGSETVVQARSVASKLSSGIADRTRRRRGDEER